MSDSEPRVKRSRFDQTEPEPKRASRFDRRSRSPPSRRSETRDRSPIAKEGEEAKAAADPAAAAAAAAARINASLQARKGIQHVDVPPVASDSQPPVRPPAPSGKADEANGNAIHSEMYVSDGDYIQDIEVNDLRNKYLVTNASTQQNVSRLEFWKRDMC